MNQRTITILVILFVLVVIGMFAYAYLNKPQDEARQEEDTMTEEIKTPYDYITHVDAKHFYIDGTHTVAGEIDMPTPCDLLEADAAVAESMPEQILINFSVINNSDTCAQVITPQRFLVSFDASEEASIEARFMGRDVELNLIPAAEGESPDDFELYIKG